MKCDLEVSHESTLPPHFTIFCLQVYRHEEFKETCAAQCNGPYENRWSKTMVGYGFEETHFVLELTYNYGIKEYKLGNEFGGVTIKSSEVIDRVKANDYPFESQDNGNILVRAPDGFKFFILNQTPSADENPIKFIIYNVSNLEDSIKYWNGILNMSVLSKDEKSALLSYDGGKFGIQFTQIAEPIDRADAFGRIAFGVPYDIQPSIDALIQKNNKTILTPLVTLDTPGKASVRVIILADPNGHEICFVDEEGFTQLSEFDPKSDEALDKYIKKDPFQV
jgi:catechol 2,3-dioxygenase-like lactoylglutathione lyase family enzyme